MIVVKAQSKKTIIEELGEKETAGKDTKGTKCDHMNLAVLRLLRKQLAIK